MRLYDRRESLTKAWDAEETHIMRLYKLRC